MKLPRFFRKFLPVSMVVMAIAMAAAIIFNIAKLNWLAMAAEILFGVSLISIFVSFMGILVVRPAGNALLRRFGKPATAMVRAIEGVDEMDNRVGVYRVKLDVHPSGSAPFVAVAEDAIRMVNMPQNGDTVPVKYDPFTKEVALVLPAKMKTKKEDF